MKIRYNNAQLQAAALFVSTFASDTHESNDAAIDFIIDMMERYAHELETKWVQCGGIMLTFSHEEDGVCEIEIQVEPTFLYYSAEEDYEEVEHEV